MTLLSSYTLFLFGRLEIGRASRIRRSICSHFRKTERRQKLSCYPCCGSQSDPSNATLRGQQVKFIFPRVSDPRRQQRRHFRLSHIPVRRQTEIGLTHMSCHNRKTLSVGFLDLLWSHLILSDHHLTGCFDARIDKHAACCGFHCGLTRFLLLALTVMDT